MSEMVPKVRFQGFTDDWEQRKLGDYLTVPQKIKMNVTSKEELMTVKLNLGGIQSGSTRETLELGSTTYYKRKAGQFIYGKQNFFNGSMAIIPSELDGKATSGDVPALDIHGISPEYLLTYVSRKEFWKRKESAASGTGSKRIHENILQGFEINVPLESEQKKIGSFFKQLDDLITLHQRKLDLLKEQKKGFLQKMFPKDGQLVPEVRFSGFADTWEQRKFENVVDVKSGKDYKHLKEGTVPVYGTGGYMLSVDKSLSAVDAIGIGRKGTIDKPYLLKAPFWTVDTLFYAIPKQNVDLQFSLAIFKKINWKKFDESTGVPSLSKSAINSVKVVVPVYEEQQKIGSFFKQLDDLITLHQRKLDILKKQKKGFLQKMFVS
ncbi:restriction endonuclease subunit S [Leuconostoc lactis]|uniref:restriction endonuclease subunit S n=1 Tax=Leuconostoc lactis TaxID=1246 RepID=UPI00265C909F|nr:restriction endonuclease subunit S [Leuconostoc lactis]